MKERPQIGDIVRVSPHAQSIYAGARGSVRKIRVRRDGYWMAAEVNVNGHYRWFTKGELEPVFKRRGNLGAPKGDFLRIERRLNRRRTDIALHIYIGRALLARWQEANGEVKRVAIKVVDGCLALYPDVNGPYALDATPGRMPRIHCDSARHIVTLADGRYTTRLEGKMIVVAEPLPV